MFGKIFNSCFGTPKKAFTLAEVLITLGIIGTVAALTMPNLIAKNQKQQYAVALKKAYVELSLGFRQAIADAGADDMTGTNWCPGGNYINAGKFLRKYYNVVEDCGVKQPSKCFASKYTNMKKNSYMTSVYGYQVVLASGASVALTCYNPQYENDGVSTIWIDVNGLKGPNIAGRDLFRMYVYGDGAVEDWNVTANKRRNGSAYWQRFYNFQWYCNSNGLDPDGCFGRLLMNGWKMDY